VNGLCLSNLEDLNIEKESESVCDNSDTSSCDSLNIDCVTESDETDESLCMDEDEIQVFGEEETRLCGEVGYWKDTGWDFQIVNACEHQQKLLPAS